ncbi:MAG: hypothetical protein ACJAQU_001719 [Loktanella salsilacus]|jgi:hypothetical protein
MPGPNAEAILQTWLDEVIVQVFANDFDGWADTMACPLVTVSCQGRSVIGTRDMLREKFDQWRTLFEVQRVTDMIRVAQHATFVTEDQIHGEYTTETLSHGQRIIPGFSSTITLTLQGRRWRATELISGMTGSHRHLLHAKPQGNAPS